MESSISYPQSSNRKKFTKSRKRKKKWKNTAEEEDKNREVDVKSYLSCAGCVAYACVCVCKTTSTTADDLCMREETQRCGNNKSFFFFLNAGTLVVTVCMRVFVCKKNIHTIRQQLFSL